MCIYILHNAPRGGRNQSQTFSIAFSIAFSVASSVAFNLAFSIAFSSARPRTQSSSCAGSLKQKGWPLRTLKNESKNYIFQSS